MQSGEESPDDKMRVEGREVMPHLVPEQLPHPLGTGRRGGGDHQSSRDPVEELSNQRRRRLHLTDRYRMQPDTAGFTRVLQKPQPLGPALAVDRGLEATPVEPQQQQRQ